MRDCHLSHEGAARLIGVAKSTIGRWLRLKVEMNVEAVLDAPSLGNAFRERLCIHDHHAEGE